MGNPLLVRLFRIFCGEELDYSWTACDCVVREARCDFNKGLPKSARDYIK